MYKQEPSLIGNKLKLLTSPHIIFIRTTCYYAAVEATKKTSHLFPEDNINVYYRYG